MAGDKAARRSMTEQEMVAVYEAFVGAFRARDKDRLLAVLTPDIRVWHAADRRTKNLDEYLELIFGLPRTAPRFVDIRREYFRNGFVQQNTVETAAEDGQVRAAEMCLVFRMRDGRISHIDEYSTHPESS